MDEEVVKGNDDNQSQLTDSQSNKSSVLTEDDNEHPKVSETMKEPVKVAPTENVNANEKDVIDNTVQKFYENNESKNESNLIFNKEEKIGKYNFNSF